MKRRLRLGVQIDSIDSDYDKGLIEGIASYCRDHHLSLMIFSGRSFGWPYGFEYQGTAIYQHISRHNIDALVLASGTQCNFIRAETFASYLAGLRPQLLVSVSVEIPGVTSVVVDNESGLRELLSHLVDVHACKRIALMKGPDVNPEASLRFEIYRRFLSGRGLPFDPALVFEGDFTAESSVPSLRRHLDARGLDFDALVCLNDTMAIGCLHYLKEAGIRVPQDVILTGFDDIVRSRYEYPSLTTVSQDLVSQGRLAAKYAHSLCRGRAVPPSTRLSTRAVLRQSCGCSESAHARSAVARGDAVTSSDAPSIFQVAGINWFKMQDDIVRLRQYLANLTSVLSLSDLAQSLRPGLESFGITSCAIVIFSEEILNLRSDRFRLPQTAELFFYYDETIPRNKRLKPVQFNPNEMLYPAEGHTKRNRVQVATALYHREQQLGYIVYERGECDPSLCEALCVQLSSTIRYALVFGAKTAAEEGLKQALTELESYNKRLSDLSQTDELTGLNNRRGFISLGQQSMDLAIRMNKNGLVVISDMDGLKRINDTWGHDAGDRAIIAMAGVLKKTFRNLDVLARLGGDEFAIVAVDVDAEFSETLRTRMDKLVAHYNETSGEPFALAISTGAVVFRGGQSRNLEALLALADSALYVEKRQKQKSRR